MPAEVRGSACRAPQSGLGLDRTIPPRAGCSSPRLEGLVRDTNAEDLILVELASRYGPKTPLGTPTTGRCDKPLRQYENASVSRQAWHNMMWPEDRLGRRVPVFAYLPDGNSLSRIARISLSPYSRANLRASVARRAASASFPALRSARASTIRNCGVSLSWTATVRLR